HYVDDHDVNNNKHHNVDYVNDDYEHYLNDNQHFHNELDHHFAGEPTATHARNHFHADWDKGEDFGGAGKISKEKVRSFLQIIFQNFQPPFQFTGTAFFYQK
ncbi:MAG: hypothetical protein PHT51_05485, partial [Patescibacteria group bacterium]|nr:hypothetical protein [Patescibacteria group bacterium]